ncbi:YdeI/OmpD-associated family protein [Parapedobacter lycopersici]|uniref:YdeI/OmpD-associated family protein n=1 Tax=Parapedobacter lycopersici TaxID=1864939 RepID=UPI003342420B
MVDFSAIILRFDQKGEKSGWSYIELPAALAQQIKPHEKRSFRVRGTIDGQLFAGMALVPMGDGDFILPINSKMRRQLKKQHGAVLQLSLEEDVDFKIEIPEDLEVCLLQEDDALMDRFMSLAKSRRNYFINYINEAKTLPTRAKRMTMTVEAMAMGLDFGAMIRLEKSRRSRE